MFLDFRTMMPIKMEEWGWRAIQSLLSLLITLLSAVDTGLHRRIVWEGVGFDLRASDGAALLALPSPSCLLDSIAYYSWASHMVMMVMMPWNQFKNWAAVELVIWKSRKWQERKLNMSNSSVKNKHILFNLKSLCNLLILRLFSIKFTCSEYIWMPWI